MKLVNYPKIKNTEDGFELRTFSDSFEYFITAGGIKYPGKILTDINERVYEYLKGYQIPVSFDSKLSPRVLRFKAGDALAVLVKVSNFSDSRLKNALNLKKNVSLNIPLLEFYLHEGNKLPLSENHLLSAGIISGSDLLAIRRISAKTNIVLKSFFERRNLTLGNMYLEFSSFENQMFLSGNFLPDTVSIGELGKTNEELVFSNQLTPKQFLLTLSPI